MVLISHPTLTFAAKLLQQGQVEGDWLPVYPLLHLLQASYGQLLGQGHSVSHLLVPFSGSEL